MKKIYLEKKEPTPKKPVAKTVAKPVVKPVAKKSTYDHSNDVEMVSLESTYYGILDDQTPTTFDIVEEFKVQVNDSILGLVIVALTVYYCSLFVVSRVQ